MRTYNAQYFKRFIAVASFVLLILFSTKANATDIKKQWVSAISESISFSFFIDRLYETECERHLPARNSDAESDIQRWLRSQFLSSTGRQNFDELFRQVRNASPLKSANSAARRHTEQLVKKAQNERTPLSAFCPEMLDKYRSRATDIDINLREKTIKILASFPDGIVVESF